MALTQEQQAIELIGRARQILVTTREHATKDSIASAFATSLLLKKLNKTHDVVIPGWKAEHALPFLSADVKPQDKLGATRSLRMSLDVTQAPLSELMYDVKDGVLEMTIVPKHGEWQPKDVVFRHGDDRYDLIIALDAPDFGSLGEAFREKADFFYRTTVINIDANPTNEYWGQVNLVDLNAVSTTEVLHSFIDRWNSQHVTPEIATALLAGMIANTHSFRTANVTPHTLATSSRLMERGARREEIVNALWRTRSLPVLKLWGIALTRLEQDRDLGLVWTTLLESDFLTAGARPEDVEGIVSELLGFAPEAKVVAIGLHTRNGLVLNVHAQPPLSAAELVRPLGGTGSRDRAVVTIVDSGHPTEGSGGSGSAGMKKVVETLALSLSKRLAPQ